MRIQYFSIIAIVIALINTPDIHAEKISETKGKLLIVGGALSADNESVYRAFIDHLPSKQSQIAIIPVASGKPVKNADTFKENLMRYGFSQDKIAVVPLAVKDDPTTEYNEKLWSENANNPKIIEALEHADGFWFVGGDQMRIVDSLRSHPKRPSKLLTLLQKKLHLGAIIGGTSAGAAMMSDPMIAAGDSFATLTQKPAKHYKGMASQNHGRLYLHHGLGFFPYGLVDQHFDRKGRLGRLVRALTETDVVMGFGVDEDTGMLVELATGNVSVVGSGNVVIVDTKNALTKRMPFLIRDASISVLSPSDQYNLENQRVSIQGKASSTIGNEYSNSDIYQGAGMALGNQRLAQLLGYELIDNAASKEVKRYSFIETGDGFVYHFRQTEKSNGFWRYISGTKEQYTIVNVELDIQPVQVNIKTIDQ